jgi:hypothetical protein
VRPVYPPEWNEKKYGNPGYNGNFQTSASFATRGYFKGMRVAGAQARRVLIDAVATKWGVPAAELSTEPSVVVHKASNRRIGYGEIAAFAKAPAAGAEADRRFGDDAMVPGDDLALAVDAGLDVVRRHRPKLAAADIVLAGPDQLDRLAGRFGEAHCVECHLLRATTAISAAEEMLVEDDVRPVDAQQSGNLGMQSARSLGADPDLDRHAIRSDCGCRVQRLHLRVIHIPSAIFATVYFCGAAQGGLDVAVLLIDRALAALVARDHGELFKRALAVQMRPRRIRAPCDLEQVFGGLGGLDARSKHTDAFRQLHDVDDARNLPRRQPSSVFVGPDDKIYVGVAFRDEATRRNPTSRVQPGELRGIMVGSAIDGSLLAFIPDPSDLSTVGAGTSASGIAADAMGNVYAADVGAHKVRKYILRR